MQAPVALPRCFAEILCPTFVCGSLREFRPRCRSFTVIHRVLPQNCASSVRKIYSQITLVQLCGIALTPVFLYFLVWRRPETGDRFEKRIRQRIFPVVRTGHLWGPSFSFTYSQFSYCTATHTVQSTLSAAQGELPEGQERVPWGITVPHDSLARYNRQHPRR